MNLIATFHPNLLSIWGCQERGAYQGHSIVTGGLVIHVYYTGVLATIVPRLHFGKLSLSLCVMF